MSEKNGNLIKSTCKELDLTYKELGELIGYSEATLNKNASTGQISRAIEVAINLYLENLRLQKELEKFTQLKDILKDITK